MKKLLLSMLFAVVCSSVFANITQNHWRWRNNDGTEQTATWKAAQDAAITINDNNSFRLRAEIYNDTNDSTRSISQGLQYATSASGPWFEISDATPLNAFIFAGDGYYITNNTATTKQLTAAKYPTFQAGSLITGSIHPDNVMKFNRSREFEWHIKPTQYTLANTTYYFRATNTEGAGGRYPSLTTGNSFFKPTVILPNGGFEGIQQVWTPSNSNGSTSTMDVNSTANQVHSGSKALKIVVTNRSSTNSVKLTHSGFTASAERTYMLRFWAFSETNNAALEINFKSAAGDNINKYRISRRFDAAGNGWQAYEHTFKVPTGPVSLEITFNSNATYYLDDVEIFDDNHPNIDVKTQYKWQYNHPNPGWISGDNDTSVELPDGRVAWVFSDSFMGTVDPHTNIMSDNRIINNLVVVEDTAGNFSYVIRGTPGNSQSLFAPIGGRVLWNDGAVVDGDQLKVVLVQVNGLSTEGTYIGTLSLPDLQIVGTPERAYGHINAIMADGDYHYIYYGESIGNFERYTKVARVKKGQLHSQIPWEYFTNDNTWSLNGQNNAKRLISGAVGTHVLKLGPGSYVMNSVPNLSGEIAVWFAASPSGPWINKTVIYNTPNRESVLAYFGHIDAGSGKDGVYTFTYSSYPFIEGDPVPMQRNDKGVYTIHYAKANLLELSPFTPKKQPDSLTSYSAKSVGRNAIIKWTTALSGHERFEVEESTDLTNWTVVANVEGGSGNSYQAQFRNPAPGNAYYRLKMYGADKTLTTSQTVKFWVSPTVVPGTFTATATGSRIRINFSTTSEVLNPSFRIGRSANNTTNVSSWSELATVEGAGTKVGLTNYEVFDENPLPGVNYYVLEYYSKGKKAYTDTRSAQLSSSLTAAAVAPSFSVYPNPSQANIQFALKGYKGSAVTATVTDLFGKVVSRETLKVNSTETYTLRNRPAAGTYFVNVNGTGINKTSKVILQ